MAASGRDGDGEGAVLIFPAGMPRALEYLHQCLAERRPVVGASSVSNDPARARYPSWRQLPFVVQPEFGAALAQVLNECAIRGIYTANPVVWHHLKRILPTLAPAVRLVNDFPVDTELAGYRDARRRAQAHRARPLALASAVAARPSLTELELAALLRSTDVIPGMCDGEKIAALCEIARRVGPGDVVEIGSWWGKSAHVLAWLAAHYGIGEVLCVDPWSNADLVQHDAAGIVDAASASVDADEALAVFEMNLLGGIARNVNYLRLPSLAAERVYRASDAVVTAAFGETRYTRRIAVLHVDGNHAPTAVAADIAAWSGHMAAGGWIVVDDYRWPYGDGPRLAADEFVARHAARIDAAFFMGGALFARLAQALPSSAREEGGT